MSLLNDADYIIHQLRVGYLRRVGERIGERVITFNPTVLSNDYIKIAETSYPEMHNCHSPNISISSNDYFKSTSSACPPISGVRVKTYTELSNKSKDAISEGLSIGDSDDETDIGDENGKKARQMFSKLHIKPNVVPPPPVFITSPSKPPTSRQKFAGSSYSPGGALKTSPESILGISSNEQTPQLSPATSTESDKVLEDRRGSEASLLTTDDGAEILSSSPPPKEPLSPEKEKKLFPDPSKFTATTSTKPISALSVLIAEKKSKLDNPFREKYSFFAGKGDLNPIKLKLYLPFCKEPTKPLVLIVKRDASVEEVIGYTLYQYWDEKREPILESRLCNVVQWIMRIVEDDGEIDEDIALERTRKISKFAFDQFALCIANPTQVKQNEALHAKMRSPTKESMTDPPTAKSDGSTITTINDSTTRTNTLGSTVDLANQIFLRIRLTQNSEVAHTTTINVSPDMHFYEVLDVVCQKRKLDSKDYTFKIADSNIFINLENTVDTVGNEQDLVLVPRVTTPTTGDMPPSPTTIKERTSKRRTPTDPPQPLYVSSNEYMSVYKKYLVYRKTPMFVGRHERVLAIDGDYIHIMPSETRTMFESMKTSSYHITAVSSCKPNKKAPSNFKLVIYRDSGLKTYDFEAESPKTTSNY
ncbi:22504_t:CDS:2 [Entrophospora sp. SA101]|nr:10604_t:CDS:2 [Entrophospora sp. SA101]CAJ0753533.1 22504_t:CDS:2 [Entrophospora sp. SA101]CAJ0903739.1 11779_t:CDS:2 [Entrophospora sp. SA101]CAJ0914004.1 7394_t:CDS:2 [Entrophospora sp. SA101]